MKNRSNRLNRCLLVLLSIAVTSCSSSTKNQSGVEHSSNKDAPAWVNDPYFELDASRYISSVGTGRTVDESTADARKQIAEMYRAKVKTEFNRLSSSKITQSTSGSDEGDANDESSRTTNITTEMQIRNSEVKQFYRDPRGNVYAQLIVDKLKARSAVQQELLASESKLDSQISRLENISNASFKKISDLRSALDAYELLQGEAVAMQVSVGARSSQILDRAQKVFTAWDERLKNEKVAVVQKTGPKIIGVKISVCLNEAGVPLAANKDDVATEAVVTDTAVTETVTLSWVNRASHMNIDGWTKVKGTLSAEVIRGKSKRNAEVSGELTGRDQETVLDLLAEELSLKICSKIIEQL